MTTIWEKADVVGKIAIGIAGVAVSASLAYHEAGTRDRDSSAKQQEAVDKKEARISVRTAEGTGITAIVDDKKNLNGVKIGDHVDITYTEAVMIAVEPAR